MASEDGEVEFSHLSWHPDPTITTTDPHARSQRELSNTSSGHSSDPESLYRRHLAPPNQTRLPPSVVHRLLTTGQNGPTQSRSSTSQRQDPEDAQSGLFSGAAGQPHPTNQTISVDDRFRDFAQVVEQAVTEQPELALQREAFVQSRRKAAEEVQPTLEALRAWNEASHAKRTPYSSFLSTFSSIITKFHCSVIPPSEKLLKLVHQYFPPRGELPIHVCDFGDGQANHFVTTLGEVEKCWQQKPEWAAVRWIHAPLGWGLTHSSVEDLFRHASSEPWPFRNVAGPNWPYVSCEVYSLENRDAYKRIRDVGILAGKVPGLSSILDRTKFRGDNNAELQSDIKWRANHVGSNWCYMDLVRSDIGYQLNDGRGLGYNGPRDYLRYTDIKLDEQILPSFPFFGPAQIVRCPFRCFHRPDGVILTMSAMRGVNYLDKNLSQHLDEPPECLFTNSDASVLGQVWRVFSETGTKSWRNASTEWFLVYLMTELVCTPHEMTQGSNAPTIQAAYQMIIQDFKRRRFDEWKRGDSIKLVREYIMCTDELSILVHIMSKQLDFLYRLKKDCQLLDAETGPLNNPQGKTAVSRCDWAIANVEENFSVLDAMLKDLRGSMVAVSNPLLQPFHHLFYLSLINRQFPTSSFNFARLSKMNSPSRPTLKTKLFSSSPASPSSSSLSPSSLPILV